MRRMLAIAAAALLISTAAHADKMYQWTDANGVVHFSDKAPPPKTVVKQAPETVTVEYADVPYNNQAEERLHGALRTHGVKIRTITIKPQKPSHSKPTGR